jgi:hypothetical protein
MVAGTDYQRKDWCGGSAGLDLALTGGQVHRSRHWWD